MKKIKVDMFVLSVCSQLKLLRVFTTVSGCKWRKWHQYVTGCAGEFDRGRVSGYIILVYHICIYLYICFVFMASTLDMLFVYSRFRFDALSCLLVLFCFRLPGRMRTECSQQNVQCTCTRYILYVMFRLGLLA